MDNELNLFILFFILYHIINRNPYSVNQNEAGKWPIYVILSRNKQNLFAFDGIKAEAERRRALIL